MAQIAKVSEYLFPTIDSLYIVKSGRRSQHILWQWKRV